MVPTTMIMKEAIIKLTVSERLGVRYTLLERQRSNMQLRAGQCNLSGQEEVNSRDQSHQSRMGRQTARHRMKSLVGASLYVNQDT